MSDSNPLLAPWTTPFQAPPFDLIRPEHFVPAFEHAMRAHLDEVAAIGADPAPPSFANTIEAMQRSGRLLARVGAVFSNLVVSLGGDALQAVDVEMSPRLAQHGMAVALDPALFLLPGAQLSNAPRNVVTSSLAWTPNIGSNGLSALFYVDGRMTSDYNTGSDLAPEKKQDGFPLVNARVGLRGPNQIWALEVWAQNLTNQNYVQVAFNSPFQGANSVANTQRFGQTASKPP